MDAFVVVEELFDDADAFLDFFGRGVVGHCYVHQAADIGAFSNILNGSVCQLSVGYGHQMAFERTYAGAAQANTLHTTIVSVHHHTVANIEGLITSNYKGADKMFDGILRCQRYCQTTNTQTGNNGGDGLVAQNLNDLQ